MDGRRRPGRHDQGAVRIRRPLSSSTVRKIHYIIRGSLHRAVRQRQIGVYRTELVDWTAAAPTEPNPPSPAEAAAFLNEAWTDSEWGVLLSATTVERYLPLHGLGDFVAEVAGRREWDPALLKPNPHLVQVAARALAVDADPTCLVGDMESDMVAAAAAGVVGVGYANKPGKNARLAAAGAAAVDSSKLSVAAAPET